MSGHIWDTSVADLLLRPSTSTEVTVSPAALSAKTDISTAQQALGRPLPVVIGTGRVDGIYFVGGLETVSTVTTTDEEVPIPLQDTFVVVGGLPNAAGDLLNQAAFFAPRHTTSTSTTETETRTMAGYVLAYDAFERGYNLVRLEIDGTPVYDIEAGIPETTTFRFYGGRHSSTDEILTEIIGTNAGAYENFVMVFIDGYPADSPPLVSAVISNTNSGTPLKTSLQSIITDVMSLAGFGPADLTFEGFS